MKFPADLVTIVVTGTYTDIGGNALDGTVSFHSTEVVKDTVGKVVLSTAPVTARLDKYGRFSVILPCTDNVNLSPAGFKYHVSENITGLQRNYQILLPSTLGARVDITQVI